MSNIIRPTRDSKRFRATDINHHKVWVQVRPIHPVQIKTFVPIESKALHIQDVETGDFVTLDLAAMKEIITWAESKGE